MLKKRYKNQITKLFSDLLQYAEDNASYVDCDTCFDESYLKVINKFEKRFDLIMSHLDDENSYSKSSAKKKPVDYEFSTCSKKQLKTLIEQSRNGSVDLNQFWKKGQFRKFVHSSGKTFDLKIVDIVSPQERKQGFSQLLVGCESVDLAVSQMVETVKDYLNLDTVYYVTEDSDNTKWNVQDAVPLPKELRSVLGQSI